jgi:hypothetical protein
LWLHDGSEGLSPDGWLPDRISIGVLTSPFPPELVDEVVGATATQDRVPPTQHLADHLTIFNSGSYWAWSTGAW